MTDTRLVVTEQYIQQALRALSLPGQVVCLHSSLRSFGHVTGGASVLDIVKRYVEKIRAYRESQKDLLVQSDLVGNYPSTYMKKLITNKDWALGDVQDIEVRFEIYTFQEIGLSDLLDEKTRT